MLPLSLFPFPFSLSWSAFHFPAPCSLLSAIILEMPHSHYQWQIQIQSPTEKDASEPFRSLFGRTETISPILTNPSPAESSGSPHTSVRALDVLRELAEPIRTLAWVLAFFKQHHSNRIPQQQLYRHYKSVFGASSQIFPASTFLATLIVAFPNASLRYSAVNDPGFTVEGIISGMCISFRYDGQLTKLDQRLDKQVETYWEKLLSNFTGPMINIDPVLAETSAAARFESEESIDVSEINVPQAELEDTIQVERPDLGVVAQRNQPNTLQQGQHGSSTRENNGVEAEDQKSTRKARKSVVGTYDQSGPDPRLVFTYSTVNQKKNIMQRFEEFGGTIVDRVQEANVLCVGKGALRKTSKLLLAIILRKTIVTEQWLISSADRGRLLDPKRFLPQVAEQEKAWSFSLKAAIEHGPRLNTLLERRVVILTPALKICLGNNTFKEYKTLMSALGAWRVVMFSEAWTTTGPDAIFIGTENDVDTMAIVSLKQPLWSKDMIPLSILRGVLQVDEKLQIGVPLKEEEE